MPGAVKPWWMSLQVCVPIDPELAWEFDPDSVPTVASLLAQLNTNNKGAAAAGTGVGAGRKGLVAVHREGSGSCALWQAMACFQGRVGI